MQRQRLDFGQQLTLAFIAECDSLTLADHGKSRLRNGAEIRVALRECDSERRLEHLLESLIQHSCIAQDLLKAWCKRTHVEQDLDHVKHDYPSILNVARGGAPRSFLWLLISSPAENSTPGAAL